MDKRTFNRHIDIPTIYLQLKHPRKTSNSSSLTFNPPTTSFPTSTDDDNNHSRTIATNENHPCEILQPIRRSGKINIVNKSAKIQTFQPSDIYGLIYLHINYNLENSKL